MDARQSYGHVYRLWEVWSDKPWRISLQNYISFFFKACISEIAPQKWMNKSLGVLSPLCLCTESNWFFLSKPQKSNI
jgi:hypothetical protein